MTNTQYDLLLFMLWMIYLDLQKVGSVGYWLSLLMLLIIIVCNIIRGWKSI